MLMDLKYNQKTAYLAAASGDIQIYVNLTISTLIPVHSCTILNKVKQEIKEKEMKASVHNRYLKYIQ